MKPALRISRHTGPLDALRAAKRAAMAADWSLRQWVDFSRAAYETLDAEASEESLVDFWRVVAAHFEVTP